MMMPFMKKQNDPLLRITLVLMFIFMITGCGLLGTKPTYTMTQYTLEYACSIPEEMVQTHELIHVENFTAGQAFDTSAMVYKEGPNLRNTDLYNRWRVKPGDMVTDFLIRDFKNSGLFTAVFSDNDSEEARYLLKGQVDEFLEVSDRDGQDAVFTLNVTFLDLDKKETADKIIFQRNYRFVEPCLEKTPLGFAQGMSKAMEKFSKEVLSDIYQVLINRRKNEG